MFKVTLINMPFADLWFPSIALTQLKAILEEQFQDSGKIRGVFSQNDLEVLGGPNSLGEELTINHFLPLNYGPFLDTLERIRPH